MKASYSLVLMAVIGFTSVASANSDELQKMNLRCSGSIDKAECVGAIRWASASMNCSTVHVNCEENIVSDKDGQPYREGTYCAVESYFCTELQESPAGGIACPQGFVRTDLSDYTDSVSVPFLKKSIFKKWATDVCMTDWK